MLSRLTTDTTLVQAVVGSSLSMGLRNAVMGVGALAVLVWTNPYVMVQVLGGLVLILLPTLWFGRRGYPAFSAGLAQPDRRWSGEQCDGRQFERCRQGRAGAGAA